MNNNRIGIFGGSFNPIHNGHLVVAQNAIESFDLTTVLFIPCALPAHKDSAGFASPMHRAEMISAAIEGDPRFELSDIEIRKGGTSYSVETVSELKRTHHGADLFFIIGSDSLPELYSWKRIYDLLSLCTFITVSRPGFLVDSIIDDELQLKPPWPTVLMENTVTASLMDVSSSDIRYRIAEGMSIRYLVPDSVEMYICEHNLYQL